MNQRKFWVSLLAGLLAALMIFGIIAGILPTYVSAAKSSSEIKKEIDALKAQKKEIQAQLAELEGKLSDNMDKMEDIVAQKDVIDRQIALLHQQVQNINTQIISYGELIADKQAELEAATARYEKLNAAYKERIRVMEEDGQISYWLVLFKANSFSDLLDRLSMIEEIAASDQRRLQELNQAAESVKQAKADLEAEKTALEESKKELEDSSAQLDSARAETDALLKQLIETGEEFKELIEKVEEKESQTNGKLDKLEDDYDAAKDKEYQDWLASQKPVYNTGYSMVVDGVTWLLPMKYDYFSSPFGYRWHPIHGDWRFHYGVDLSAPTGRPIVAARSGVITRAAYEAGGAGYYVNIDHKDGFVTRYMHMTHFIVKTGQYVRAGEIIGYCGSTGGSTGPHLHYGVYYNGTAVNPAKYIPVY